MISKSSCRELVILTLLSIAFIGGLSCAKQGIPPGNKEDKEPPKMSVTTPAHMAVGVSTVESIVIEFTSPMSEKDVENNFFIVPIPAQWPEFSWRKGSRELTVSLAEPLRGNTTYIISIGAKAGDTKGNKLEDTINLTFSTGDTIEDGTITGMVIPYNFFDERPDDVSGVDVVAYSIDTSRESPDPRHDVPDYFTQSGADGLFEIRGLSQAEYRLFAIGDSNGDGFYSEGSDRIGVASLDVMLARDDSVAVPPIMVAPGDTSLVSIRSVRSSGSQSVDIYFDRAIVHDRLSVGVEGLKVEGYFIDSERPQKVTVATGQQENEKKYTFNSITAYDADGNTLASLSEKPVFTGTDRPDTTSLKITSWGPQFPVAGSGPVQIVFNKVLDLPDNDVYALKDESGEDLAITQEASNILSIFPADGSWKDGYRYSVSLDPDMLQGVAGNILSEEDRDIVFRIAPADTLGFMSGVIEDADGSTDDVYRLSLKHLETGEIVTIETKGPAEWSSGGVLPGLYLPLAYRDIDGDGTVFRGSLHPYRFAEPVAILPDTVMVSSRWTTEDIRIVFK
ncbi:Ig-like domain-containing protein [Candidatus Latescibacterota bacterium]